MTIGKKWILTLVLAGSTVGGALGGVLIGSANGNAAGAATTTSSRTPNAAPSGKFVPNENASHEANESAARIGANSQIDFAITRYRPGRLSDPSARAGSSTACRA